MDLYLKFDSKSQAIDVLSERFPEWDGANPHLFNGQDNGVVVQPPSKTDSEGNPIPNEHSGLYVNLRVINYNNEYEQYRENPNTPWSTWA